MSIRISRLLRRVVVLAAMCASGSCNSEAPSVELGTLGSVAQGPLNSCLDGGALACVPPSKAGKVFVCHAVASGYLKLEVSSNAKGLLEPRGNARPDRAPGATGLACDCQPRTCANVCVGAADGTECQDDGCHELGVCQSGACVSDPLDCSGAGDACNLATGECVGMGQCVTVPQPGAPCDDDDVCNGHEVCDAAGSCQAGTAPSCDDADDCTDDACDPTSGCAHTPDDLCEDGCTFVQGYWKTHDGSPSPDVWPVSSLSLGSETYTHAQLSSILDQAVAGNGLVSLADQLITAKLNIASGADPSGISSTVASADALIDALVVPPVGSGYLSPASTSALVAALVSWNEGTTGPGPCQ